MAHEKERDKYIRRIIQEAKEAAEKNKTQIEKNNEFFAKARGYDLDDPQQLVDWGDAKEELFSALAGSGPDQRKFVEIYRYENILPPQN